MDEGPIFAQERRFLGASVKAQGLQYWQNRRREGFGSL
jgi:hypothetical protein